MESVRLPQSDTPAWSFSGDAISWAMGLFLLGHLLAWTGLPLVLHPNLPLDTIEMNAWGQQWELGYHKHPPLPAWITYTVATMTGGASWGIYLTAQVCVVACFWAAWKLGREMLPPRAALLGALVLESSYYYNYEALELNNNIVLYPFWALAVLALYWSVTRNRLPYWFATGALLGLAMLCKYSAAVLAVSMLAFGVLHPDLRKLWRTPGPYVAGLAAALVFGPHLGWAIENGFPPIRYAVERTAGGGQWYGRIAYPLEFAGGQALALLPLFLVLTPLTGWRWRLRPHEPSERFQRHFLIAMVFVPLLLHLGISFALNVRLKSMYGSHLWTFAGVAMLFFLKSEDASPQRWRRTWIGCAVLAAVMALALAVKSLAGPYFGEVHRIHFPGRALAAEVEAFWRRHDDGPLPVVAGDGWMAGNVAFYGSSRPTVYDIAMEPGQPGVPSPWMNAEQLLRTGGIVLWDARVTDAMPHRLRAKFPRPLAVEIWSLPPHTRADVPPLRIGAAIYPGRQQAE